MSVITVIDTYRVDENVTVHAISDLSSKDAIIQFYHDPSEACGNIYLYGAVCSSEAEAMGAIAALRTSNLDHWVNTSLALAQIEMADILEERQQ